MSNIDISKETTYFGNFKFTLDKKNNSEKGANVNDITDTGSFTTIVSKTVSNAKGNAYVEFYFTATENGTVKIRVDGSTFLRIYYKARDPVLIEKLVPEKVEDTKAIDIQYKPDVSGADAFANIAGFNL